VFVPATSHSLQTHVLLYDRGFLVKNAMMSTIINHFFPAEALDPRSVEDLCQC